MKINLKKYITTEQCKFVSYLYFCDKCLKFSPATKQITKNTLRINTAQKGP